MSDCASLSYEDPFLLLANWPEERPLIWLGGSGRFGILGESWEEVSPKEALGLPLNLNSGLNQRKSAIQTLPFHYGLLGLISYDEYSQSEVSTNPSRFFQIKRAIVFDRILKKAYWCKNERVMQNHAEEKPSAILEIELLETLKSQTAKGINLIPLDSDSSYLKNVNQTIADIKDGRFYQLNLLRYFDSESEWNAPQKAVRLRDFAGKYGAWLKFSDLELLSFSPERFVTMTPDSTGIKAKTFPIKGTASRSSDPVEDSASAQRLKESIKDQAELNIIIDLMRNDLNRVSQRGSVMVKDPGAIKSFPTVHHRVARIESYLKNDLCLGEFLQKICPGGSITGAPKIEVMKAIREYEGRARGYFMGNIFLWDRLSGRIDSSILIRTMVKKSKKRFQYAAGSGIVVGSDPEAEMAEIKTKCRIVES